MPSAISTARSRSLNAWPPCPAFALDLIIEGNRAARGGKQRAREVTATGEDVVIQDSDDAQCEDTAAPPVPEIRGRQPRLPSGPSAVTVAADEQCVAVLDAT